MRLLMHQCAISANDINPFINYKFRIASYELVAHRAMLNYVIINLEFTVYEFMVTLLISLDYGEIAINTLGNLSTEVVRPD